MTAGKLPWANARVKGTTKFLQELMMFIIIAMHESGGWTESEELNRLYMDITKC